MSMPAADGAHEFIVAPELAEVAERLGLPLHAGDRVRFEVLDGSRSESSTRRRRLSWIGSVNTGARNLSERTKDEVRDGMGRRAD
ncbi:MAG: hypothetical protein M3Z25_00310 [Actinomycetota bacterium]|nr:hypothetical protein [Actinomycetota bacterium]